jgi:hypothetical protein
MQVSGVEVTGSNGKLYDEFRMGSAPVTISWHRPVLHKMLSHLVVNGLVEGR